VDIVTKMSVAPVIQTQLGTLRVAHLEQRKRLGSIEVVAVTVVGMGGGGFVCVVRSR
jgi:hypothetical protein